MGKTNLRMVIVQHDRIQILHSVCRHGLKDAARFAGFQGGRELTSTFASTGSAPTLHLESGWDVM